VAAVGAALVLINAECVNVLVFVCKRKRPLFGALFKDKNLNGVLKGVDAVLGNYN